MTRHDPPKKERWLCAFLNSFLLATPPLPSPPLLPISLLHRIRRCGWAAALPDHAPGWCFLVFVAVIPDRRVSRYQGDHEADEENLLSCGQI
jgi:hypothetical protein